MIAAAYTPDLFAEQMATRPREGITEGPTFSHPERESEHAWQDGWWFRSSAMDGWQFRPYDTQVVAWIRRQLEGGPMDYMDLLQARRSAKIEHPYHVADVVRSHVRYLVLAGEVIERKRHFGAPDARSKDYRGWHPYFELTRRNG